MFLRKAKDRIGTKYLKAVYRQYTDASFTTPRPLGPAEESLGIMGPTIHGEVGDRITVVSATTRGFQSASTHTGSLTPRRSKERIT